MAKRLYDLEAAAGRVLDARAAVSKQEAHLLTLAAGARSAGESRLSMLKNMLELNEKTYSIISEFLTARNAIMQTESQDLAPR